MPGPHQARARPAPAGRPGRRWPEDGAGMTVLLRQLMTASTLLFSGCTFMAITSSHKQLINSNRIAFLIAGFCVAAWAPMIPYIKDRFALNENDLGLLLLCMGIGSFVSMPTSGYFSSRFGCRAPIYFAAFAVAACLALIPFVTSIYLLAAILFIMGTNSVILDVVANINAALVEQRTELNVMSGLHGLYSVGGFTGSLSVTFLLSINFPFAFTGIYAAAILVVLMITGGRHLFTTVHLPDTGASDGAAAAPADGAAGQAGASARAAAPKGGVMRHYTHPTVLLIGLMCFIMFMTEGSMLDWSGVFLNSERGVSLEHAGYGFAAFTITMTIFRLTGDRIVSALGRGRVIIFGTLFIVAGYLTAIVIPYPAAAFAGFALIGVGASNVVPQLVSITARIKEVPPHISVTVVNAVGFSGVLIGPAVIGFMAHHITLPYTYAVQAAGVLCVTIMAIMLIKKLKSNPASGLTAAPAAAPADAAASAADSAAATGASPAPAQTVSSAGTTASSGEH